MLTGYSSYIIELVGYRLLQIPTFKFDFPSLSAVESVEVTSPNERQVSVKVHFVQITSQEDADSISRMIATQVTDKLAFQYRIGASDPLRGESSFEDKSQPGITLGTISHGMSAFIAGHEVETVRNEDLPPLRTFLQGDAPNRDVYYSQFRWILSQHDPVTRFMHCYKLLLALKGGPSHAQWSVDAYIVARESSVQQIFNAYPRVNRYETIYTRLRNEVGHEIAGTSPQSTRLGMEQHLNQLEGHVKAAIESLN